jgi:hypothetical protein
MQNHQKKADGWIRTSMKLFTRQSPFSVEPRRQKSPLLTLRAAKYKDKKHEREESNPVRQFWRLTAHPGAHS